jgi:hypothetical protein
MMTLLEAAQGTVRKMKKVCGNCGYYFSGSCCVDPPKVLVIKRFEALREEVEICDPWVHKDRPGCMDWKCTDEV